MKTIGPLQDCVMTTAGNLCCKKIIHINATGTDWEGLLLKALKLVDDSGMRSLSIPALGTGT